MSEYRVQWRFIIGDPMNRKNSVNFFKYYIPRWSIFMTEVFKLKLSRRAVSTLSDLRKVIPDEIKVENIYPILLSKNFELSRLLLDAAPIFDSSPKDLKVHIIAIFGVIPNDLEGVEFNV